MNQHQRHKLEYLLHLLDDEDIKEAALVLSSNPRENSQLVTRFYWVNDCSDDVGLGTSRSFPPTLNLMLAMTTGMAIISITSIIVAYSTPWALYAIPLFFIFCTAIGLASNDWRKHESARTSNTTW